MTKNKFIIIPIIILMCSVLQYFFLRQSNISESLISNIITFLSILFGFYITSLAIFVTSSFVRKLYRITDENNKTSTLLHTLLKNYRFGLIFVLMTISYLIIVSLFTGNFFEEQALSFDLWFTYFIIPFLVVNISYSYFMINDLISIVIQEAKNTKD